MQPNAHAFLPLSQAKNSCTQHFPHTKKYGVQRSDTTHDKKKLIFFMRPLILRKLEYTKLLKCKLLRNYWADGDQKIRCG